MLHSLAFFELNKYDTKTFAALKELYEHWSQLKFPYYMHDLCSILLSQKLNTSAPKCSGR